VKLTKIPWSIGENRLHCTSWHFMFLW